MSTREQTSLQPFWAEVTVPVYYQQVTERGTTIERFVHHRRFGAYVMSFQELKSLLVQHDPEITLTTPMRVHVAAGQKLTPTGEQMLVESYDEPSEEQKIIVI